MRVHVDARELVVREVDYRPENTQVFFDRYSEGPHGPLPKTVRLASAVVPGSAELNFSDWNFSPSLDAGTFVLQPPADSRRYRLPSPQ